MTGNMLFTGCFCFYFVAFGYGQNKSRFQKLCLPKSAHTFCRRSSTLTDKVQNGISIFYVDGWDTIWRADTYKSFYGSSTGQYGTALVSGEKGKSKNVCANGSTEISVWFAKMPYFAQIGTEKLENILCNLHHRQLCTEHAYEDDKKLCFAQWNEAMNERILDGERTDRKPGCVILSRSKNAGTSDCLSPSRKQALNAAESIQRVARISKENIEHEHLHPNACQKVATEKPTIESPC